MILYSVIKKYRIAMTLTRKIAKQGCIFLSLLRHSVSYIILNYNIIYIHYTRDRHVESHGQYRHDQLVTDIFHLANTPGLHKNSMSEYCTAGNFYELISVNHHYLILMYKLYTSHKICKKISPTKISSYMVLFPILHLGGHSYR